ncbi:MAG: exosortase F system-associated protein [Cyclobacteriaceae bacterium]|nr:exosortase F system-associated protein [Cyclobacteriaceae bacterium]
MNREIEQLKQSPKRITFLVLGVAGLAFVYLFQRTDALGWLCQCHAGANVHFIFNRSLRLVLNDLLMLGIIHVWFQNASVTKLAFWVQLVDMFLLLPLYLILKLSLEGDSEISSPLLSQLHRLIVNPTLMILIIPAVYFQRFTKQPE